MSPCGLNLKLRALSTAPVDAITKRAVCQSAPFEQYFPASRLESLQAPRAPPWIYGPGTLSGPLFHQCIRAPPSLLLRSTVRFPSSPVFVGGAPWLDRNQALCQKSKVIASATDSLVPMLRKVDSPGVLRCLTRARLTERKLIHLNRR